MEEARAELQLVRAASDAWGGMNKRSARVGRKGVHRVGVSLTEVWRERSHNTIMN